MNVLNILLNKLNEIIALEQTTPIETLGSSI